MIIIGEKLNGSIPSVAKAISEKDADLIRERARMQAEAGATFLDVCRRGRRIINTEMDDRSCTGSNRYTDLCGQPECKILRSSDPILQETRSYQLCIS